MATQVDVLRDPETDGGAGVPGNSVEIHTYRTSHIIATRLGEGIVIPSAGFWREESAFSAGPGDCRSLAALGMTMGLKCHNILQVSVKGLQIQFCPLP